MFQRLRDALGKVYVRMARRLENQRRVRRATDEVKSRAPRSLDGALDYAFGTKPASIAITPNQVRSELRDFLSLVEEAQPQAILEIGTALGGTLFTLTRVAAPDAIIVSVDLSSADRVFGGGRVEQRRRLYEAFGLEGQRVHFLAGDSQTPGMRRRVEEKLDGRALDVLFIDGDHSLAGVARDFELYRDLVRDGGLIAFHDIVEGRPELVGDVPAFWRSVKTAASLEFVDDPAQGGYGIGVLWR
jgi:predicted O-methyltransferase YrrM